MKQFLLIICSILIGSSIYAQKLWGMTQNGGVNNVGVIFEYNVATSFYTKKHDFEAGTGTGRKPSGSLIQAGNNMLYGMTELGGANDKGVIFNFNPSTDTYAKLFDFGTTNGERPFGSLIQASDGALYGMTALGGANSVGVLFKFTTAGVFTILHDFAVASGSQPNGSLIQASDGMLYGMTQLGGANSLGVLFQCTTDGVYTVKHDFKNSGSAAAHTGASPTGSLMEDGVTGTLYGFGTLGGINDVGSIFKYEIATSTLTKFYNFDPTAPVPNNGNNPNGDLIIATDGNLYGMASQGGALNAGDGALFKVAPPFTLAGVTYTKTHDFDAASPGPTVGGSPRSSLMQASNGILYGMTRIGGTSGRGVLFQYTTAGTYTKKFDFTGTAGLTPGANPVYGNLIEISGIAIAPLPIELLSFTANCNNQTIILKWTTASETNNDFFTLERTADGVSYEGIATIKGAGNSTATINYSFTDTNPYNEISYYRLKQTDYDGEFKYSQIIAVEKNCGNPDFSFDIFPNPSDGTELNIIINTEENQEVVIVVYDILGQEIYSKLIITEQKGNNVYSIDLFHNLSPGMYMINATSNQKIISKKLIVN